MSHVFFSYDQSDAAFAQRLIADLKAAGVKVESDSNDKNTEQRLKDAATAVVVVSPTSMTTASVQAEVEFAINNHIRLIPVMSKLAQPVPNLRGSTMLDLSTDARYNANLPLLISVLNSDAELDYSIFPMQHHVDNSTAMVDIDRDRYISVLTAIAAPIANVDGDGPPFQRRRASNLWRKLASGIPALDADGMAPLSLTRLMPPTLDHLEHQLAMPYQVLYIHSYNRDDALILEDEWGHEQPFYPNNLINVLMHGSVKLLILVGNLPIPEAETLLEESTVQAIVQLDDRLDGQTLAAFVQHVLWQLGNGMSVQAAYRAAISYLADASMQIDHQAHLIHLPDTSPIKLDLPPLHERGPYSLILSGMPPLRNVPTFAGFVGHRNELLELNREIAEDHFRQIALYGPIEAGKTWLAAEYVSRFAWRYPDGVLWMRVSAQTKSEDIVGQLLALLELPATTNWNTLRQILHERSVLIVLDQLDEWDDPLEVGELADFIARLDQLGGTRVLLTAWGPVQPITYTSGTEENTVAALAEDEARYLALQYIDHYGLGAIFESDQRLAAFLEKTQSIPWLIREGMQFVQRLGYDNGMVALGDIVDEVADPFETHISQQINMLSDESFAVLRLLQGLPDGFSRDLLEAIVLNLDQAHLHEMLQLDMLQFDGRQYRLSIIIRNYLQHYSALSAEEQATVDERVIENLLGEQS